MPRKKEEEEIKPEPKPIDKDLKRLINEIENTQSSIHLLQLKPQILKYLKGGE